jgi:hypothetical protein
MTTYGQARTFALVLVLAVVALGLLAVRSARQAAPSPGPASAVMVPSSTTPGSGASEHHRYLVALGR